MKLGFRNLFSIIAFFLFSLGVKAQITFEGNFSKTPDAYKADSLDLSSAVFYYSLSLTKDPKNPNNKTKTLTKLSVGSHYSRFEDLNNYKRDSISRINSKKESIGIEYLNALVKYRPQWSNIVIKNLQSGTMTIQDKAFKNFQYEELIPKIEWKVLPTTKKILSLEAQLAVGVYRGRKYNAWFTKEIAISNGPFVFSNLPGLIVEVYDDQDHFHFELVGIKKENSPILIRTEDKIIRTDRKKFRIAQKSYYENPAASFPEAYDANGEVIQQKIKSKPYNPIELE